MPRRFKRPRRAKVGQSLSYKYEEFATLTRPNVAYVGMTSIGGNYRLFKPVVAQLLRKLLKVDDIHIQNHQVSPEWPAGKLYDRIQWVGQYTSNAGVPTQSNYGTHVPIGTSTFDNLVQQLTEKIFTQTAPFTNMDQYYEMTELRLNSASNTYHRINRLDHVLVNVSCFQSMDIQNQMRDDAGGVDKASVIANPLKGKLYKFAQQLPARRSGVAQDLPFEARASKFEQGLIDTGTDTSSVYKVPDSRASPPVFNALFSPPNGKTIWNNCTHEVSVSVNPGAHKKFTTSFRFKGYLKTLLRNLNSVRDSSNHSKEKIGTCTLLGLEPVMRTSAEIITLGVQKEQTCSATIRFPKLPGLPPVCNQGTTFTS